MTEQQTLIPIEIGELLFKVKQLNDSRHRLVQIGCTKLENNEITYAFDKDYHFTYLKLIAPPSGAVIPSISAIYWSAFLYENEIHDLFGVTFTDMVIDFHGNFYRTSQSQAFSYCERLDKATQTTTTAEGSST
jgi:ech hydrogenase subunit D